MFWNIVLYLIQCLGQVLSRGKKEPPPQEDPFAPLRFDTVNAQEVAVQAVNEIVAPHWYGLHDPLPDNIELGQLIREVMTTYQLAMNTLRQRANAIHLLATDCSELADRPLAIHDNLGRQIQTSRVLTAVSAVHAADRIASMMSRLTELIEFFSTQNSEYPRSISTFEVFFRDPPDWVFLVVSLLRQSLKEQGIKMELRKNRGEEYWRISR